MPNGTTNSFAGCVHGATDARVGVDAGTAADRQHGRAVTGGDRVHGVEQCRDAAGAGEARVAGADAEEVGQLAGELAEHAVHLRAWIPASASTPIAASVAMPSES